MFDFVREVGKFEIVVFCLYFGFGRCCRLYINRIYYVRFLVFFMVMFLKVFDVVINFRYIVLGV